MEHGFHRDDEVRELVTRFLVVSGAVDPEAELQDVVNEVDVDGFISLAGLHHLMMNLGETLKDEEVDE